MSTLVELRKSINGGWGPQPTPGPAWGATKVPPSFPKFDMKPGSIPSDWAPYTSPREAKKVHKARRLRAVKVGAAGTAGAAGLVGVGLAARAARAARQAPAQKVTSQVSGRTLAAIGAGGVTAGVGGSLVARKRKKDGS